MDKHNQLPMIHTSSYGAFTSIGGPSNFGDIGSTLTATSTGPFRYLGLGNPLQLKEKDHAMATSERRLVQIFVIDPDKRVPLEDSLLYQGEQKLTDATDQELYFELNIKELIDSHNAKRRVMIDKEARRNTGKSVFLDEVRVRDLRMQVLVIASF